jgi:hypothetical protein
MIAPLVGITEPTAAPYPPCDVGHDRDVLVDERERGHIVGLLLRHLVERDAVEPRP